MDSRTTLTSLCDFINGWIFFKYKSHLFSCAQNMPASWSALQIPRKQSPTDGWLRSQGIDGQHHANIMSSRSDRVGRQTSAVDDFRQIAAQFFNQRDVAQVGRFYWRTIFDWNSATRLLFPLHGWTWGMNIWVCENIFKLIVMFNML